MAAGRAGVVKSGSRNPVQSTPKLFDEVNERVTLPQWAINGIARVFGRIDCIKRQLSM